jgi:putative ABC transport system ATP-binding protein
MKILEVQNISKSYIQAESRIDILKNLSLTLEKGTTTSIVGQSGSGKSTLLSLLSGMDSPEEGHIFIAGQDITLLPSHAMTTFRGQNIGIVFQQFHLMPHLTALENVSLPMEILGIETHHHQDRALAALDSVGLSHRHHHLPQQLSGGECQRVAIARALVVKPALLLADEPSGNLDAKTGDQIMELLFSLVKDHNSTLLLVTHNLELAGRCDQALELSEGQLHEIKQ